MFRVLYCEALGLGIFQFGHPHDDRNLELAELLATPDIFLYGVQHIEECLGRSLHNDIGGRGGELKGLSQPWSKIMRQKSLPYPLMKWRYPPNSRGGPLFEVPTIVGPH